MNELRVAGLRTEIFRRESTKSPDEKRLRGASLFVADAVDVARIREKGHIFVFRQAQTRKKVT